MLSDGAKIALATSVPAGAFIILFAIATYCRRRRLARRPQATFSQVSAPRALEPRPLPTPPESPGLAARKLSFAPPQFEEASISVRRLSADPDKNDIFQRVNSVSSSLNAQYDPFSENLPLGGRKSSVTSLLSEPEIGPGQRMLSVRKVSAGGGEDVVDIPCAQPETDTEAQEIVQTRISGPSYQPTVPTLDPPPSARSARRHRRPDSITITLKAKPRLRSAPLNTAAATKSAVESTTGTPFTAKSPWTASTEDQSAGVVFEAWRGFLTGDKRIQETKDIEDIHSPTQPEPDKGVQPDESTTQTTAEAATTETASIGTALAVPVTVERPRSLTLPRTNDITSPTRRLSLQSFRKSPLSSPGTHDMPKSQNKVTYLSDVVKELDENPHLRLTHADLGKTSSLSHLTKMIKAEATRPVPFQPPPSASRISPLPPVIPVPDGLSPTKDLDRRIWVCHQISHD